VEIRYRPEMGAYPSGVMSCGSVWVCAVCGAKIKFRRGLEVEAAAATWTVLHDGKLAMVTLTVRHFRSMSLAEVMAAVSGGWRKLRNRKEFRALRKLVAGTIKATEVTVGKNGWHVHIHLLLFVNGDVGVGEVENLAHSLFDPWAELAAQVLGVAPDRDHGVHITWMDAVASAYVSKIGNEITRSDMKVGKTANPLVLLDEYAKGDMGAMRQFAEFGDTMKGRHSLDWSPGLRDFLGLKSEKSDEELAAEVVDGEVIDFVDGRVWNRAHINRNENGVPLTAVYLKEVVSEWLAK
jgi:hypothetical protein